MKIRTSLILAIAASLFAVNGQAMVIKVNTSLDNSQEVTPSNPAASEATGKATLSFNTRRNWVNFDLRVRGIFLEDITFPGGGLAFGVVGPVHLHNGLVGTNAGIFLPFANKSDYRATNSGFRLQVKRMIAPAGLAELLSIGSIYVNVHTLDYGSGEIRGQLNSSVPEPSTFALLGLAGMGLMLRRRKAIQA